jgi:hypothetical protein
MTTTTAAYLSVTLNAFTGAPTSMFSNALMSSLQ